MKLTPKELLSLAFAGLMTGIGLAGAFYFMNMIVPFTDALAINLAGAPNIAMLLVAGVAVTFILKHI